MFNENWLVLHKALAAFLVNNSENFPTPLTRFCQNALLYLMCCVGILSIFPLSGKRFVGFVLGKRICKDTMYEEVR
mgnify:FL=1